MTSQSSPGHSLTAAPPASLCTRGVRTLTGSPSLPRSSTRDGENCHGGPKRRWIAKSGSNRLSLSSKLGFDQSSCRRAQACRHREPEICMSQPFSGLLQRSPDVRSVRPQTFADLTLNGLLRKLQRVKFNDCLKFTAPEVAARPTPAVSRPVGTEANNALVLFTRPDAIKVA